MRSLVLLSGGIDSAVALALELRDGHEVVDTLTVHYGQKHRREITAAQQVAMHYGVANHVTAIDPALFRGSSLTGAGDVPVGHATEPDSTFVPGRNTVLIALAAARAESVGAGMVVLGANADDAAGYPDCRRGFIESFRETISASTGGKVWLAAPLLGMTKSEIIATAIDLGVPLRLTWSCYLGGDTPCGRCGACESNQVAM